MAVVHLNAVRVFGGCLGRVRGAAGEHGKISITVMLSVYLCMCIHVYMHVNIMKLLEMPLVGCYYGQLIIDSFCVNKSNKYSEIFFDGSSRNISMPEF